MLMSSTEFCLVALAHAGVGVVVAATVLHAANTDCVATAAGVHQLVVGTHDMTEAPD